MSHLRIIGQNLMNDVLPTIRSDKILYFDDIYVIFTIGGLPLRLCEVHLQLTYAFWICLKPTKTLVLVEWILSFHTLILKFLTIFRCTIPIQYLKQRQKKTEYTIVRNYNYSFSECTMKTRFTINMWLLEVKTRDKSSLLHKW